MRPSDTPPPFEHHAAPAAPIPVPTPAQQRVLERIAIQRVRIASRPTQRQIRQLQRTPSTQQATHNPSPQGMLWGVLLQRLAIFTKQHPVAVAALAGAAIAAGPKRLVRWAGILLPWVVRLGLRSLQPKP